MEDGGWTQYQFLDAYYGPDNKYAVVVLRMWAGGTGYWRSLHLMVLKDGEPKDVAQAWPFKDREYITVARVKDDILTIDAVVSQPGDFSARPTGQKNFSTF